MRIAILTFFLSLTSFCLAQEVSNVRAVQNGAVIDIYYKIQTSSSEQFFTITIRCDTGSGERFVLRSLSGDAGKHVQGGKSEYKASWNVLEDIPRLGSAEFFVQAKLEKGTSGDFKPGFAGYQAAIGYTPVGFRLGYGVNFGPYLSARIGSGGFHQLGNSVEDKGLYAIDIGLFKSVYQSEKVLAQIYVGVGMAQWGNYLGTETVTVPADSTNGYQPTLNTLTKAGNADKGLELDYGLQISFKEVYFTIGGLHNRAEQGNYNDMSFGVGLRF